MRAHDRTGFVVVQLSVARAALRGGDLAAARTALRQIRTTDFFGGAGASESYLAVVRDQRSTDDDIREAIDVLVNLRAVGIGAA